jgi:predicted MFS family arabinose efflux permease
VWARRGLCLLAPMARTVSERTVVLLIGAVQLVNVLDFAMVSPLGPDFTRALDIPASHVGSIVGSYSLAAALSGLLGALFLDRFDRRKALAVSMAGLVLGTLAGGLATGFATLLATRVLAGVFGGPATSLALSIVADVVPPERRGKAMGTVMSAFSAASILGIPLALELALWGGWRVPFLATGAFGALVTAGAVFLLPPIRGHLLGRAAAGVVGFGALLRRPEVRVSYALVAAAMMAGFLVIPSIPVFVQGNLGVPRELFPLLPTLGGVVSFLTLRAAGRQVDRFGSFRVGLVGALLLVLTLVLAFLRFDLVQAVLGAPAARLEGTRLAVGPLGVTLRSTGVILPALAVFLVFYLALGTRNVANITLTSKVPRGAERARFTSLQSFVQHAFMALGAFASSQLLVDAPGGGVAGVERVVGLSIALSVLVPVLMWELEGRLNSRKAGGGGRPRGEGLPSAALANPAHASRPLTR